MADVERIYTVPLRKAFDIPRTKRASKAVKLVREFVAKHMKVTEDHIILSEALNSNLWARGIQKPPRRVKIKITKEGDKAVVRLIDEKVEVKKPEKKVKEKKEEEEKTPEEIKAEEKKKEIEKEMHKQDLKTASPNKNLIKDLKK